MRLPRVTAAETLRALRRDGWMIIPGTGGSHIHHRHDVYPGLVSVPSHSDRILAPKTIATIIRQAAMTVDRFVDGL